jgi:ferredoxin
MPFSVTVDSTRCEGHGLCVLDSPGVFQLDDDGYATVVIEQVSDELRPEVDGCVRGCPAGAISVVD